MPIRPAGDSSNPEPDPVPTPTPAPTPTPDPTRPDEGAWDEAWEETPEDDGTWEEDSWQEATWAGNPGEEGIAPEDEATFHEEWATDTYDGDWTSDSWESLGSASNPNTLSDLIAGRHQTACVDPPEGNPPGSFQRLTGAAARGPIEVPSDMVIYDAMVSQVSFGASGPDQIAIAPPETCDGKAWQQFYSGGNVHPNMPDFNFPQQPCDDDEERCIETRVAWMHAHHNVWAARTILHYMADKHVETRRFLWDRGGVDSQGNDLPNAHLYTAKYWFGPYTDKRFDAIKKAVDKLWTVITTNKHGGFNVQLRCPTNSGNVCQTAKPAAHHWVRGKIDLCDKFFDGSRWGQAHTMSHELLHHLWTKWGGAWVAIQDTHYHGHGWGCGLNPETKAMYGENNIRHLATYANNQDKTCGHRARNVRNNDTYAYYITYIGEAIYGGLMHTWPKPTPPTPEAPNCVGDEGCLCEGTDSWPLNEPFEPDGDYSADTWCDDDGDQITCQKTKIAAQNYGICTNCEDFRGPGCECDDSRPCEKGSCYGDDTFGGGVGHCFEDPAPEWACLADCDRLFNSDAAWCYADYPTGQARCMDHLCSAPEAYNCALDGKVCRYGECVVECQNNNDCADKGYPGTFSCQQNRCEFNP